MRVFVLELENREGRRGMRELVGGLRELEEDAVDLPLLEAFLPVGFESSVQAFTSVEAMVWCSVMLLGAIERPESTATPSKIVDGIWACGGDDGRDMDEGDDERDMEEGDVDRDVDCCDEGNWSVDAEVKVMAGAGVLHPKVGILKPARSPVRAFPADCAFSRSMAPAVVPLATRFLYHFFSR